MLEIKIRLIAHCNVFAPASEIKAFPVLTIHPIPFLHVLERPMIPVPACVLRFITRALVEVPQSHSMLVRLQWSCPDTAFDA